MNNDVKTLNLDLHAAETAQQIIKALVDQKIVKAQDAENLITKALGVLQENGIYACALFLYASKEGRIADAVCNGLLQMTAQLGLSPVPQWKWQEGLKFVSEKICSDLDQLLLVRQLWEQTLIYARYGAKAWKEAR
jgi:hypothetical protein